MNSANQTRFVFERNVPMRDVSGTLLLARLAAASLHGHERVALETACDLDRSTRTVSINANTDAGHTLALVFLGYVRREFGEDAFELKPASKSAANNPTEGAIA